MYEWRYEFLAIVYVFVGVAGAIFGPNSGAQWCGVALSGVGSLIMLVQFAHRFIVHGDA